MRKNLLTFIFACLMVTATMAGAMAFFDWEQPLTTGSATTDPYIDNQVMSYLQIPASNIASNCSIPTTSFYQLLTDPETHNIWVQEYSQISLYDKNCNLLYQKLVNGTTSSNGFMYDWDGDGKPQLLTTIKTPDGTISFASYEWNGSVISNDFTLDLGASVVATSSVYCARGTDICAVWNNDGYVRRIFLNSSYFLVTSAPFSNYFQGHYSGYQDWNYGLTYSPIGIVNPYGDIDGDGHDEVIYYTTNYYYVSPVYNFGFDVFLYDPIDDTIDATYDFGAGSTKTQCGFGNSGTNHQIAFVGSPLVIARTGFSNSVPKLFFACSGWYSGYASGGRVNIKILDQNFNVLDTIYEGVPLTNNGDFRLSNFVFGDYDADNLLEHCIINKANLTCYEGDYSVISACQIPTYTGESLPSKPVSLAMVNYQSGGNKEFLTPYGIKDLACNPLYQIGGYDSSYMGSFTPVDLSNDNALDWLWMDTSSGRFFSTGSGGGSVNCTKTACPYGQCKYFDDFSYTLCPVNDMSWNIQGYGVGDIYPTGGKFCYDATYDITASPVLGAPPFYDVLINEWDMNVTNTSFLTKDIYYLDSTNLSSKDVVSLWFWLDGDDGSIGYLLPSGGMTTMCNGCFARGQEFHIKVTMYHFSTNGAQFFNTSSGMYEYIRPQTFSVIINNNTEGGWYNLEQKEPLIEGHSNMENRVEYVWDNKNCIDNEVIRGDLTSYGNATCSEYGWVYSYPVLWQELFGYTNEITSWGWRGYPFVSGDNRWLLCNKLYYDRADYGGEISYDLQTTTYTNFTYAFQLKPMPYYSLSSYTPYDSPVSMYMRDNLNRTFLHFLWDDDGYIKYWDENGTQQTLNGWGNYSNSMGTDYLMYVYPDTHTFDWYYTATTSSLTYTLGGANLTFNDSMSNFDKVAFKPEFSNTSYGFFLDNLKVTEGIATGGGETLSFCPAGDTNCLFYDEFNYSDSTYNHGWYNYENTPINREYVTLYYDNSNNFDHTINQYKWGDGDGMVTFQFHALFNDAINNEIAVYVRDSLGDNVLFLTFADLIYQQSVGSNFTSVSSYTKNTWNTYSIVMDTKRNSWSLYVDGNIRVSNRGLNNVKANINKIGFNVLNETRMMQINYVKVYRGADFVSQLSGGTSDTGVPSEHLKNCWMSNGSFDWSCCEEDEIEEKDMWCPTRVTALNLLGNTTQFALTYFLYFIIIIIIVVVSLPFLLRLRER